MIKLIDVFMSTPFKQILKDLYHWQIKIYENKSKETANMPVTLALPMAVPVDHTKHTYYKVLRWAHPDATELTIVSVKQCLIPCTTEHIELLLELISEEKARGMRLDEIINLTYDSEMIAGREIALNAKGLIEHLMDIGMLTKVKYSVSLL